MRAFTNPLTINGGTINSTDVYGRIVQDQVIDAVITNARERVMRPDYGANLQGSLFDPSDKVVRADMARAVQQRLEVLTPRASIDSVEITNTVGSENLVRVHVNFTSQFVAQSLAVDVPLNTPATTDESVI